MASAIALVLVMGTGYNSMQSFGQGFDAVPGFDIASKFGQSADCAGMLNDCGNDNSVQNPPEPTPEPTPVEECALCLAELELTEPQEFILLRILEVDTLAEACERDGIDVLDFYHHLTFSYGFPPEVSDAILECLGLELPSP